MKRHTFCVFYGVICICEKKIVPLQVELLLINFRSILGYRYEKV